MDYEVTNLKTKSKTKLAKKTQTSETNENKDKNVKTLKIRLFPSQKEKDEIKVMMEQQRWYFNATISIMNKNYTPEQLINKNSWSYIHIRDLLRGYQYSETVKNEKIEKDFVKIDDNEDYPVPKNCKTNEYWWKDVNGRVVRGASKKFTMALNSGISNLKSKNISTFTMKYKSKKDILQCLHFDDGNYPAFINKIRSTYWFRTNRDTRYPKFNKTGIKKTRCNMSLKEIIEQTKKTSIEVMHDSITDKYYVHMPVDQNWYPSTDIRNESQIKYNVDENTIISLDPGVRKFLVGYDPKGNCIFFGEDAQIKLIELLLEVDKVEDGSHLLKWRKIKNLVDDLHWKCINYLVKNYTHILLPDFRVKQMLCKKKLGAMTKRLLNMFSFYTFKERIKYVCKKYNKKIYIVDESYTSCTCGICGKIYRNLGGKKVYNCEDCNIELDRDASGARNILIKNIKIKTN